VKVIGTAILTLARGDGWSYNPRFKLPAIHLTPCPACPDWPASQQRGSAVGTNSR
jgi:hypothetical protein